MQPKTITKVDQETPLNIKLGMNYKPGNIKKWQYKKYCDFDVNEDCFQVNPTTHMLDMLKHFPGTQLTICHLVSKELDKAFDEKAPRQLHQPGEYAVGDYQDSWEYFSTNGTGKASDLNLQPPKRQKKLINAQEKSRDNTYKMMGRALGPNPVSLHNASASIKNAEGKWVHAHCACGGRLTKIGINRYLEMEYLCQECGLISENLDEALESTPDDVRDAMISVPDEREPEIAFELDPFQEAYESGFDGSPREQEVNWTEIYNNDTFWEANHEDENAATRYRRIARQKTIRNAVRSYIICNEGCTTGAIAEATQLNQRTVQRIVEELIKRGAIRSEVAGEHRTAARMYYFIP